MKRLITVRRESADSLLRSIFGEPPYGSYYISNEKLRKYVPRGEVVVSLKTLEECQVDKITEMFMTFEEKIVRIDYMNIRQHFKGSIIFDPSPLFEDLKREAEESGEAKIHLKITAEERNDLVVVLYSPYV